MIIGIDAHNIRGRGGGYVHLFEFLNNIEPAKFGITKVIVWSNKNTLVKLPNKKFIQKKNHSFLERNLIFRLLWQYFILKSDVNKEKCEIILVPGGIFISNYRPYVVMAQNLLPFDDDIDMILTPKLKMKLFLQRTLLKYSFKNSSGTIFISHSSQRMIENKIKHSTPSNTVIYHGVSDRFFNFSEKKCSTTKKILLVGNISRHKGYFNLIDAFIECHEYGLDIEVTIIGSINDKSGNEILSNFIKKIKKYSFIKFLDRVDYNEIHKIYFMNDYFVFGSRCEAFGLPLIEAMASKLSIACNDIPTFNEIARDNVLYFDINNKENVKKTLMLLLTERFENKTKKMIDVNKSFNWNTSANNTVTYLLEVCKR